MWRYSSVICLCLKALNELYTDWKVQQIHTMTLTNTVKIIYVFVSDSINVELWDWYRIGFVGRLRVSSRAQLIILDSPATEYPHASPLVNANLLPEEVELRALPNRFAANLEKHAVLDWCVFHPFLLEWYPLDHSDNSWNPTQWHKGFFYSKWSQASFPI